MVSAEIVVVAQTRVEVIVAGLGIDPDRLGELAAAEVQAAVGRNADVIIDAIGTETSIANRRAGAGERTTVNRLALAVLGCRSTCTR